MYSNDRLDELIPNLALVLSYNELYARNERFYYMTFLDFNSTQLQSQI